MAGRRFAGCFCCVITFLPGLAHEMPKPRQRLSGQSKTRRRADAMARRAWRRFERAGMRTINPPGGTHRLHGGRDACRYGAQL